MAFPCLVDKKFCKTNVLVTIDRDEMNEDGEIERAASIITTCNLQMGARVSMTKEKEKIELVGVELFIGEICHIANVI